MKEWAAGAFFLWLATTFWSSGLVVALCYPSKFWGSNWPYLDDFILSAIPTAFAGCPFGVVLLLTTSGICSTKLLLFLITASVYLCLLVSWGGIESGMGW